MPLFVKHRRRNRTQESESDEDHEAGEEEEAATMIQAIWRGKQDRIKLNVEAKSRHNSEGFYTHEIVSIADAGFWAGGESKVSLKRRFYLLFEDPSSSRYAQVLSVFILATIIISIACFVVKTMPEFFWVQGSFWRTVEYGSTVVFSVEFGVRLFVCDEGGLTRYQFFTSPMNVIDIAAILPFFVEQALALIDFSGAKDVNVLRLLRIVRLIRLFRIFKLGRYSSGMRLMGLALQNSLQALWVLAFFLCVGVVLFSSLMYYAEKVSCPNLPSLTEGERKTYVDECDAGFYKGYSPSHGLCCTEHSAPKFFPSIFAAFWWSIVTMTTVGFGDIVPRTAAGQFIGFLAMLVGMVLIALPVAIVGQKFQDAYENNVVQDSGPSSVREKCVISGPDSGICNQLKGVRVKDQELGTKLSELARLLEDTWDRRGAIQKMQKEENARQKFIHRTFKELMDGLGEKEAE